MLQYKKFLNHSKLKQMNLIVKKCPPKHRQNGKQCKPPLGAVWSKSALFTQTFLTKRLERRLNLKTSYLTILLTSVAVYYTADCMNSSVLRFPPRSASATKDNSLSEPRCEKTSLRVSDQVQVRHKRGCTATEDG